MQTHLEESGKFEIQKHIEHLLFSRLNSALCAGMFLLPFENYLEFISSLSCCVIKDKTFSNLRIVC